MNEPLSISHPKLLIGEGVEELRLFNALVKHLGLAQDIQVMQYGGKPKLGAFLRTLRATHGFTQVRSLGITRDADDSAQNAHQSVETLAANAGFPENLNIRILALPGAGRGGALEDLCLEAVNTQRVWPCVEELITCRIRVLGAWPDDDALAKAKVHAWLSTQHRPELRLGDAAADGLVPFEAPAFVEFVAFVRSL